MDTPKNAAWVVRKIIGSRKKVIQLQNIQGDLHKMLGQMQLHGKFQIKKAYCLLLPQLPRVPWKTIVLHKQIHPRFKFNLWLAAQKRLSTFDRLQKIGIQVPMECVFCDRGVETFDYLFFACSINRGLWGKLLQWLGHYETIGTWKEEIHWICNMAHGTNGAASITCSVFGMMVYCIWQERNSIRFQPGQYNATRVYRGISLHMHIKGRHKAKWQPILSTLNCFA
ncbi:uncharacterized protein LOC132601404 [Lycium barbarum]|uniref:uncharacterized protein LOC132601404 n=1 Tax=Lycium barbarum TaxID=112863 RepID=UPI00293E1D84|nr:uncharacterized protein LOC132601404 [Lycium barbarum]